ncbi:MAG: HlyD family efflux transporter periplasmic adaptor subunit [Gammaproteobacteria bacterium]|nr:HlyD family efflux transporter periplasmic adaptor subunit [Gammaproteobacteria bacterium]QOJ32629.1 MAG: HlyD family efflux transporter periplasmic adaptor subunit [Gammaproteobacteria bacterium]
MPTATQRRLALWLPIAAATVLGILWLSWPRAVAVDFARVAAGPIEETVSDEGETRVKEAYVVSAPLPGLMQRIALKAGDAVVAGQTVMARIEPSDPVFLDRRSEAEARAGAEAAQAAQKQAVAAVARAEADLDFASAELQRYRGLAAAHTISANDLDAAERRARTAAAALDEARAARRARDSELAQARARLLAPGLVKRRRGADCDCVDVFSPVSGSVLRVIKESEGVVSAGAPLLEVGDTADLEIVTDLLSTAAVKVRAGQSVRIEAWGGDGVLAGRVRRVEPYGFTKVSALGIEEQRVNVIIDFTDPPQRWQRLGHGYRVEPRIVLAAAEKVLKVPQAALFRHGDSWAVFVDDGGRARLREVRIGLANGLEAEITQGLAAGDEVILQPGERVADGTRVKPRG